MVTLSMRVMTASVGHCRAHLYHAAEVAVEAFYPVVGADHRLYPRVIVEVGHVEFVVLVIAQQFD